METLEDISDGGEGYTSQAATHRDRFRAAEKRHSSWGTVTAIRSSVLDVVLEVVLITIVNHVRIPCSSKLGFHHHFHTL